LKVISLDRPALTPLLALLAGALLALAFAPFFLWPLAILLPALLFWLQRDEQRWRRLFVNGWLFGLGYFGCGVYWIYNSLHDFGQAPPVVAAGITALLVVYLALAPGVILVCWRCARNYLDGAAIWLLPPIWFGLEWFKGWFITGMPWLSLGYSQTPSPLAGYAPLIGVYGIGALCILMAVILVVVIERRRYAWLLALLAIPLGGYALQQNDWTRPMPAPLKVTMVQGNVPQELKWRRDQRDNIFNTYWRETSRHWDSDLIIWPETALPGHSLQIASTLLPALQAAALERDSVVLAGLVYAQADQQKFYNSVMQFGRQQGLYHKRHLVVFGEYYPMRWLLNLFSGLINIPYSDMSPGPDEQPLMQVGDYLLGVSICWEDVFSRDILLSLPAANLLVNLSNDAWFGNSTAPHQHMQIAQMRSLESERVMMRATNTGITAFIDHKGRVLSVTEQFRTESISEVVHGRSGVTPFYYFARVQWLFALLPLTLLLLAIKRWAGR